MVKLQNILSLSYISSFHFTLNLTWWNDNYKNSGVILIFWLKNKWWQSICEGLNYKYTFFKDLQFSFHSPYFPDLGELQSLHIFTDTFRAWAGCGAGRDQLRLEQPWAILLLHHLGLLCHFLLSCSRQRLDPLFGAVYCGHLLHCCQLQEPQPHCCDVCTPSNGHRGQGAHNTTVMCLKKLTYAWYVFDW